MLLRVSAAMSGSLAAEDGYREVLAAVCETAGWTLGHALGRSDDGSLESTGIWHPADATEYASFRAATARLRFGIDEGMPGRVLRERAPVWLSGTAMRSGFARIAEAEACGLRSALAVPVVADGDVQAVLEFFSPHRRTPGAAFLDVLRVAGEQLGLMIERDRARAAGAAVRARVDAMLDAAGDAFVAIDARQRILAWNRAAAATFGWERHEVLGRALDQVIIPERFRAAHHAGMDRYRDTGEGPILGRRIELWGMRRDGTEVPLEIIVWPTPGEGGGVAFHAFLRDVSVQRAQEAELRRVNEELLAANTDLSAFSYSVSHDLRAPIRAIHGYSELLDEHLGPTADPQSREWLGRIRAAAARTGTLVEDMLRLSRVSSTGLDPVDVDVSALATSVLTALQYSNPERAVRWTVASGLVARADARLMRILLENLLGNAWKFTRDREPATIEVGQVPNGEFFVRDNGAGFDMAYADRLFEPFTRLHSDAQFEGTGIGLATVRRVVQRHGGSVRAEAALDRGATLYFSLGS